MNNITFFVFVVDILCMVALLVWTTYALPLLACIEIPLTIVMAIYIIVISIFATD